MISRQVRLFVMPDATAQRRMQQIAETTEVIVSTTPDPSGPAVDGNAAPQTRKVTVKADPSREYVSSSGTMSYLGMVQAMPQWIDDLTRDLGMDVYQQMTHDPVVASSLSTKVMAALARPVTCNPCKKEEDDPDFELAQEISDFCLANLYGMKRPLSEWLYEMCWGALVNGHKAAEQVYELREVIPGKGKQIAIKAEKCKPHRALRFVQDAFNNTVGLAYARPGQSIPIGSVFVVDDPAITDNLIPREKFAILSWQPENDDPRGHSDIRQIYGWWLLKVSLLPHYNAFLARFGQPSIVGEAAPDAADVPQYDTVTGEPLAPLSAVQALLNSLLGLQSGGVAAVPNGAHVELLQTDGNGEAFASAIEMCDKQIRIKILGQSQSTGEAKFGTRGLGEVHKDVQDLVTDSVSQAAMDMLSTDVLKPLVTFNYGDKGASLLPELSMSEVKDEDMSGWLPGLAAVGYKIAPEHEPEIDAKLDLTPRQELTPLVQPVPPVPPGQAPPPQQQDANGQQQGQPQDNQQTQPKQLQPNQQQQGQEQQQQIPPERKAA